MDQAVMDLTGNTRHGLCPRYIGYLDYSSNGIILIKGIAVFTRRIGKKLTSDGVLVPMSSSETMHFGLESGRSVRQRWFHLVLLLPALPLPTPEAMVFTTLFTQFGLSATLPPGRR